MRVSTGSVSVVPTGLGARLVPDRGSRRDPDVLVASGRIRATYRGSIDLFDHLREPLIEHVSPDDPLSRSFEDLLDEIRAGRPGCRAMAEALLRRCLILLLRRYCAGRGAAAVLARRARGRAARPCRRPHAGAARAVVQPAATRRGRRHEPFGLRRPLRRGLEPISDRVSEGTSARPGRPAPHAHRLAGEGRRRPSGLCEPERLHARIRSPPRDWAPGFSSRIRRAGPGPRAVNGRHAEGPPWQAIAR